jgi:hypothetical protein
MSYDEYAKHSYYYRDNYSGGGYEGEITITISCTPASHLTSFRHSMLMRRLKYCRRIVLNYSSMQLCHYYSLMNYLYCIVIPIGVFHFYLYLYTDSVIVILDARIYV